MNETSDSMETKMVYEKYGINVNTKPSALACKKHKMVGSKMNTGWELVAYRLNMQLSCIPTWRCYNMLARGFWS